jgi:hypothetical protein
MMEYVNIMEAARRSGKSDKTIRRAIRAGRLPATFPQPNRCEIAVSDLENFLHGQVSRHSAVSRESRIDELERRLAEIERLVERLVHGQQDGPPETKRRTAAKKPRASRVGTPKEDASLPQGLILLQAFVSLHAVSSNEADKRWKAGFIHVVKQPKAGGKHRQVIALDGQGRRDFWIQFHTAPGFRSCDQCPHEPT